MDPVAHLSTSFLTSQHLSSNEDTNVAFSPFSISSAMLMTSAGASGKTLKELHSSLFPSGGDPHLYFKSFSDSVANNPVIAIANTVYLDKRNTIKKEFKDKVKANYNSDIQVVPFSSSPKASCDQINKWVEDKTKGKIPNLVPQDAIKSDTTLVLVNAIYFKATWRTQFDKNSTKPAPFHFIDNKKEVQVPTMIKKAHFGVKVGKNATFVELPYKEAGNFSMLIVLPSDNSLATWNHVTSKEYLESIAKLKSLKDEEIVLLLPKFKVTWKAELKEYITDMGVKQAFTEKADFSGMINEKEALTIGAIIHEAVVEVDENGTEAAAATAVVMMKSAAMMNKEPPREIRVDHPFLFFIRQHNPAKDSYTTIFSGYVKTF